MKSVLVFPAKVLRARAIARYMRDAGMKKAVVFTCGNSATALRREFVKVLEIGKQGTLTPNRWWTPAEIKEAFPDYFDATSGHLPTPLLVDVAAEFKAYLRDLPKGRTWFVPTGSGETLICLRIAFPDVKFCAVYDNAKPETTRDDKAPLNCIVDALFPVEHWNGKL